MARPDGGMFGIKLIHPNHLKYPYLTEDFDGGDGRRPLMNFTGDERGRAVANGVPLGHRSLVYVTRHQRFVWAVEYTGTVEDGERAAAAHGITPNDITAKWSVYRPIRFLAKVDLARAPTAEDVFGRTGIRFTANSFTMKYVTAADYRAMYDAIVWDWTADGPDPEPALGAAAEAFVEPTGSQIDAVLRHLPAHRRPGVLVAQWHAPRSPEEGTSVMPSEERPAGVAGLIADLYDNGFVVSFDWPAWQPTAERYVRDPGLLGAATLGSLQKLLTVHVRKDKFCEGHFGAMVLCGHVRAILERLAEIRGGS